MLKTSQSSHKDIHRNALDSLIKIVDFSAGYFLSTPTIEIFSESINNQASSWAGSSIMAYHMSEKRDYIIIRNEQEEEIIAPVDYNGTGVVQDKLV